MQFLQVLMTTVFVLARIGQDGNSSLLSLLQNLDEVWLCQLTVSAWLIINPLILIGIVLETPMDWKLVSVTIHERLYSSSYSGQSIQHHRCFPLHRKWLHFGRWLSYRSRSCLWKSKYHNR